MVAFGACELPSVPPSTASARRKQTVEKAKEEVDGKEDLAAEKTKQRKHERSMMQREDVSYFRRRSRMQCEDFSNFSRSRSERFMMASDNFSVGKIGPDTI